MTGDSSNGVRNLSGVHQTRQSGPPVQPVVAESEESGMLRFVGINNRIQIIHAEFFPQRVDFVVIAGQIKPSLFVAVLGGILFHHFRRIVIGINADRNDQNVFAHSITQVLVNLHEVQGSSGSYAGARGVHEINDDDMVLDHIIVKANGPTVVCL